MRVIYGVDPGVTGAVAIFVDGRLEELVDMPSAPVPSGKGSRVQAAMLAEIVRDAQVRWPMSSAEHVAVIEQVSAMPTDGGIQAFAFGHAAGCIEGVFSAMGVAVELVSPSKWKADMGLTTKRSPAVEGETPQQARARRTAAKTASKDASRAMAARFYPSWVTHFARKRDDGRAEGVLLGRWFTSRRGDAS